MNWRRLKAFISTLSDEQLDTEAIVTEGCDSSGVAEISTINDLRTTKEFGGMADAFPSENPVLLVDQLAHPDSRPMDMIVAVGNAFDGLILYGPFPGDNPDYVNEWCERHLKGETWEQIRVSHFSELDQDVNDVVLEKDDGDLTDLIYRLLRRANDPHVNDVTLDGDHKSSEIVLTWDDGKNKQDFIIKAEEIDGPTEV